MKEIQLTIFTVLWELFHFIFFSVPETEWIFRIWIHKTGILNPHLTFPFILYAAVAPPWKLVVVMWKISSGLQMLFLSNIPVVYVHNNHKFDTKKFKVTRALKFIRSKKRSDPESLCWICPAHKVANTLPLPGCRIRQMSWTLFNF